LSVFVAETNGVVRELRGFVAGTNGVVRELKVFVAGCGAFVWHFEGKIIGEKVKISRKRLVIRGKLAFVLYLLFNVLKFYYYESKTRFKV
jgi:hypothetical protein